MTQAPLFSDTAYVPPRPHSCGSWIVIDRTTGLAVFETFKYSTAQRINQTRYEVLTALDYLVRINGRDK